jgi:hypothetical protein
LQRDRVALKVKAKDIHGVFRKFDLDNSGTVDYDEFRLGLRSLGADFCSTGFSFFLNLSHVWLFVSCLYRAYLGKDRRFRTKLIERDRFLLLAGIKLSNKDFDDMMGALDNDRDGGTEKRVFCSSLYMKSSFTKTGSGQT